MIANSFRLFLVPVVVVIWLAACGDPEPAPLADTTAVPTPDIEATVVAEVRSRLPTAALTPTPSTLSTADTEAVLSFAGTQGQIIRDWEDFHSRLDTWRELLSACDATTLQVTLREFAATMGDVATQASELPRTSKVRRLADSLIEATEGEAIALRLLRDEWVPDSRTLFDNVDSSRSTARRFQGDVEDALTDLQERLSPESISSVADFASAVDEIGTRWDRFRRNYDSFRNTDIEGRSAETVKTLGKLVDELRDVVVAFRGLPGSAITRDIAGKLAEAAEAEDLALRKLRGTFEKADDEADSGDGPQSSGEAVVAIFTPRDPSLFDAFDAQLLMSNAARRQAADETEDLLEEITQENRTAADAFAQKHLLLRSEWAKFRANYDEWRRTEGGCDRSKATETLGAFTTEFGALTRRAREVPGGTLLGSLREILVEAAELEEKGLRDLRNTWRPFDAGLYRDFDARRISAAKLLRQLVTGLEALLDQYDLQASEQ